MNRASRAEPFVDSTRSGLRAGALVIGLTGGIGAGKSRLAAELAVGGAVAIDADRVGHELLERAEVRERVVAEFGPGVLGPDGAIDRAALGAVVFGDAGRLDRLEAILHPRMAAEFLERIESAGAGPRRVTVVLDAAILHEAGWAELCDHVVFVDAPAAIRHGRLAETRGWSAAEIARREVAQWPLDRKRRLADQVVRGTDEPAAIAAEVLDRARDLVATHPPD